MTSSPSHTSSHNTVSISPTPSLSPLSPLLPGSPIPFAKSRQYGDVITQDLFQLTDSGRPLLNSPPHCHANSIPPTPRPFFAPSFNSDAFVTSSLSSSAGVLPQTSRSSRDDDRSSHKAITPLSARLEKSSHMGTIRSILSPRGSIVSSEEADVTAIANPLYALHSRDVVSSDGKGNIKGKSAQSFEVKEVHNPLYHAHTGGGSCKEDLPSEEKDPAKAKSIRMESVKSGTPAADTVEVPNPLYLYSHSKESNPIDSRKQKTRDITSPHSSSRVTPAGAERKHLSPRSTASSEVKEVINPLFHLVPRDAIAPDVTKSKSSGSMERKSDAESQRHAHHTSPPLTSVSLRESRGREIWSPLGHLRSNAEPVTPCDDTKEVLNPLYQTSFPRKRSSTHPDPNPMAVTKSDAIHPLAPTSPSQQSAPAASNVRTSDLVSIGSPRNEPVEMEMQFGENDSRLRVRPVDGRETEEKRDRRDSLGDVKRVSIDSKHTSATPLPHSTSSCSRFTEQQVLILNDFFLRVTSSPSIGQVDDLHKQVLPFSIYCLFSCRHISCCFFLV